MAGSGEAGIDGLRSALRRSHDRLASLADGLTAEQASAQSYCDDWTVAEVFSHLGSGADIFSRFLPVGLGQADPPGPGDFPAIWDRWNGKQPEQQVRDSVAADGAFIDELDGLDPRSAEQWQAEMFDATRRLDAVIRMRLSEHVLHTWDIAVSFDPAATLPGDGAALVLDHLAALVARAGQPTAEPVTVAVTTSDPQERLTLVLAPSGVRLAPGHPADDSVSLTLPAEAFIRLAYGRLDPGHTPAAVTARGVDLDLLRRSFPGF